MKGGLLAEEGAFVDPKKAEEMWVRSRSRCHAQTAAWKSRETAGLYPTGLDKCSSRHCVDSRRNGVNLEFMGAADRQQAGVLEQGAESRVHHPCWLL